MKNKNKNDKRIYIIMGLIILIVLLLIGISFALLRFSFIGKNTNSITTGSVEVRLDEYENEVINLINTYPLTDNSGMKTNPYRFTLVNHSNYNLIYTIRIVLDENAIEKCGCKKNILDADVIRYELNRNGQSDMIDTLGNKKEWIIDTHDIKAFEEIDYNLRLWLFQNAGNEYMGKHFHAKIKVDAVEDR